MVRQWDTCWVELQVGVLVGVLVGLMAGIVDGTQIILGRQEEALIVTLTKTINLVNIPRSANVIIVDGIKYNSFI